MKKVKRSTEYCTCVFGGWDFHRPNHWCTFYRSLAGKTLLGSLLPDWSPPFVHEFLNRTFRLAKDLDECTYCRGGFFLQEAFHGNPHGKQLCTITNNGSFWSVNWPKKLWKTWEAWKVTPDKVLETLHACRLCLHELTPPHFPGK